MAASKPEQTKYMDVNGKVALITGGAAGIGLAIADNLLAAGLKKAYIADVNDENGDKALKEMTKSHGKGRCQYIRLDVNSQEQFEDAFRDIISTEGSVDILVNNAGMLNEKKWELQIDTNLKSVMRGCLLANKYMANQKGGGCVVNTGSIFGYDHFPYMPGYVCTKHGVIGLTKSFGDPINFEENGVRFVALGPGVTKTFLIPDTSSYHHDERKGKKNLEQLRALTKQVPDVVGRGTVYMVQYGPPGSLWVIEGGALYRITPPDRKTYQTKVMDLQ